MRPDKPGLWWFENREGQSHIEEYAMDAEGRKLIGLIVGGHPEELEGKSFFLRWLGPAHPPKKVSELPNGVHSLCNMQIVALDDVKDFLLEE